MQDAEQNFIFQYRVTFDPRIARQWSQRNEGGATLLRPPNPNGRKSIRLIANTYLFANKNAQALPKFQAAIVGILIPLAVEPHRPGEHNKARDLAIAGRAFVVSFGFSVLP